MRIVVIWVESLPGGVPMAWDVDATVGVVTYYLNRTCARLASALQEWGANTVRAMEGRGAYAILRVAPAA